MTAIANDVPPSHHGTLARGPSPIGLSLVMWSASG